MSFKRLFFHTVIPLLIGFIIYTFLHKPNLLIHYYAFKVIPIDNYFESIKNNQSVVFIINHLPDVLWTYSLGVFLLYFLTDLKNKFLKAAIILFIGSCSEIVQLLFPLSFTFDWLDLFFIVTTLLYLIYIHEIKKAL